jgi:very-short-patch-repair endonuclease
MTKHFNKTSEKEKRRTLRKEQTYCEKILWRYLRNRQLLDCKFRRQYSIDQFVLDFYSPEIKFAIELDGDVHNTPDQKEYDVKRQEYLETFGITFLRITNDELLGNANLAFVKIEDAIKKLRQSQPHP